MKVLPKMIDTTLKKPRAAIIKGTAAETMKIDAETLIKIFRRKEPADKWVILLDEFFDACPVAFMSFFMKENGFELDDLKSIYDEMPECLQSGRFKKVLADGKLGRI